MDELTHHGILGMKWGVRRTPEQLGHEPSSTNGPKRKRTLSTKSGDSITLEPVPDSKFTKFLARHFKGARENLENSADFSIKDKNWTKVGDLYLFKESQDSMNVNWIGINKSARGRGYAQATMKAAIEIAKETNCSFVTLEVPTISPDARHVYEKLGFREVKSSEYDDEDIWGGLTNMRLDLKKEAKHSSPLKRLVPISDDIKNRMLELIQKYLEEVSELDELKRYGVLGMKWGVRRYQNYDGTYTQRGLKRYRKAEGDYNRIKNERKVNKLKNVGEERRLQERKLKADQKKAKKEMEKAYKGLKNDKLADQGKELYKSGKTIGDIATRSAATQLGVVVGSNILAAIVASNTGNLKLGKITGNSIALGGTAVNVVLGVRDSRNKKRLRAYYAH